MSFSFQFSSFLSILIVSIGVSVPTSAENASSFLQQADAFYAKREDLPQAKIAMITYERAAVLNSTQSVECFWKAARAAWWLGENTTDRTEQLAYFSQSMAFAKKAVDQNPESVEAHFWLGAATGSYGKTKGVFKSLSLVKPIRQEMAEVIRLNDHFMNGAAYRVLGVVDFKVPGLMGGDIKRSKEELDKSLAMGPSDPFVHYDLIQYYIVIRQAQKAKAEFMILRALQPLPELQPEHAMLVRKAEILLGTAH